MLADNGKTKMRARDNLNAPSSKIQIELRDLNAAFHFTGFAGMELVTVAEAILRVVPGVSP